jgi:hypothetical protein
MNVERYLVAGLPETGKTTFLAALWHVVDSGEVSGSLVVSEVHGVRDHLNKIREQWLNCRQLERTTIPSEKTVSFRLRDPRTQHVLELSLPDLSGETFRHQWELRTWTESFDKLAVDASGLLLFVHPHTVIEPVRISPALDAIALAAAENHHSADHVTDTPANEQTTVEPWSPAHTPTQVKLVEIVQFLRQRPFLGRIMPTAVVVSAWDLIENGGEPRNWLERRLPLLDQFLRANAEGIPCEVYGVSAQGGELSQATELQRHMKPSDRIKVMLSDGSITHDITAPLKWLLER